MFSFTKTPIYSDGTTQTPASGRQSASRAASVPTSIIDITGTTIELLPAGVTTARELTTARTEWERRKRLATAGG